ncbi:hypothetical protein QFZ63_003472 [Streptomyces sp. B3I7]|uniref:hypothetical protein n=1 Tax=Streptomyces sp. B3I7 TaxID=3042269 RepID=UPI0027878BBA|nr:hypothetical protein [Streptomyces sp. B3I7]MDQ0811758.1 hypothetical protein [Streptomyces sp. B3I7]
MTSRNKIAVVSWVVGGIAMTCAGVAHAQASAGECTSDARGNVTCVNKGENSYTSEDGTVHVHQAWDCATVSKNRLEQPQTGVGLQGTQSTEVGNSVKCSNSAP